MAISDRTPTSPSGKVIHTSLRNTKAPLPISLAALSPNSYPQDNRSGAASLASKSVASKSTSSKSTLSRRRIAFSKDLTADKQLFVPRATEWRHGVVVQSAQTGNPMFAINHCEAIAAMQGADWGDDDTEAIISEVDPTTKRVGKILALIRWEGDVYAIYTYFRAYPGQSLLYYDQEFYQGNMFRYGEVSSNKKRCYFARASSMADDGLDFFTTLLEAAGPATKTITTAGLTLRRNKEWILDMRDPITKQSQITRDTEVDAVTLRAGQNILVSTCLIYAVEFVMNAS